MYTLSERKIAHIYNCCLGCNGRGDHSTINCPLNCTNPLFWRHHRWLHHLWSTNNVENNLSFYGSVTRHSGEKRNQVKAAMGQMNVLSKSFALGAWKQWTKLNQQNLALKQKATIKFRATSLSSWFLRWADITSRRVFYRLQCHNAVQLTRTSTISGKLDFLFCPHICSTSANAILLDRTSSVQNHCKIPGR